MQFLSADFIFDGYTFLPEKTILVVDTNQVIVDILSAPPNEDVNHFKGLLMPGLINAHCHLELSHLKGVIEEHIGLVNFLLSVNTKRNIFSHESIHLAIKNAEKEMIQNGIVAVGDISNGADTLLQKQQNNLHYHTFIECFGLLNTNAEERFKASLLLLDKFSKHHTSSIVLHAPYSISDSLIQLVNEVSNNKITTIHNQECEDENKLFLFGEGNFLNLFRAIHNDISFFKPSAKTSLQTYFQKLTTQQKIILVHNTVTSKEDIKFAQSFSKELYWCLCPNANLYIENKLPDIDMMIKNNCTIVLGTDSLASNHRLNIMDEILTIQKHFPDISLAEKLKWATSNSAEALGMKDNLGSFEKGKQPGIVQIENIISKEELPKEGAKLKVVGR